MANFARTSTLMKKKPHKHQTLFLVHFRQHPDYAVLPVLYMQRCPMKKKLAPPKLRRVSCFPWTTYLLACKGRVAELSVHVALPAFYTIRFGFASDVFLSCAFQNNAIYSLLPFTPIAALRMYI